MASRNLKKYRYNDLTPKKREGAASGRAPGRQPVMLRLRSKEVMRVDDGILALLDEMAEIMQRAGGSGLAAIQIGVPRRVIVVKFGGELLKLINPVIVEARGKKYGIEGCLSIPGVHAVVRRPEKVVVQALNEQGKPVRVDAVQGLARVLCHEIDHLDGILIIDRAEPGTIQVRG